MHALDEVQVPVIFNFASDSWGAHLNQGVGRSLLTVLLFALGAGLCAGVHSEVGAEDLETAFAASFAFVPEVARSGAGPTCKMHGLQAAQVALARDSGMGAAAALSLLAPPPRAVQDSDDDRVDAAVARANTAIVALVFGPTRPTAQLAGAIVNGACLLGAERVNAQIRS